MREITRERLIEERDVLLFDILQELKKINLRVQLEAMPVCVPVPEPKAEEKVKNFNCRYCGGTHEKAWQIGLCAKENKKKEGAK